jgi:hypothetical protein
VYARLRGLLNIHLSPRTRMAGSASGKDNSSGRDGFAGPQRRNTSEKYHTEQEITQCIQIETSGLTSHARAQSYWLSREIYPRQPSKLLQRGGFSTYGSVSHVFQPRLGPRERGTALLARLVLVHVSRKLTEERGGLWSSGCPNPARIRIRRPDRRDR